MSSVRVRILGVVILLTGIAAFGYRLYQRSDHHCARAFAAWASSCASRDSAAPPTSGFNIKRIAEAAQVERAAVEDFVGGNCKLGFTKRADIPPEMNSELSSCGALAVACSWSPKDEDTQIGAVCENGQIVRLSVFDAKNDGMPPRCRQCGWPQ